MNSVRHEVDQRIADLALVAHLRESQPFVACAAVLQQISSVRVAIVPALHWPPRKNPAGCNNPACAAMIAAGGECKSCANALGDALDAVNTISCCGGLRESALPIWVNNRLIAFLCLGPYVVADRRASKVRGVSSAVTKQLSKMPRFSVNVLSPVLELLKMLSNSLARIASEHIPPSGMPAGIKAARQFVEQNYSEAITLATVAQHAGMSRDYFCRTFKKALGIGFSEFLNRTRIEDAKTRLRDASQRVTEIYDQVGFKSLTHFNRTFKRIVGVNPTTYRHRLLVLPIHSPGKPVATLVR